MVPYPDGMVEQAQRRLDHWLWQCTLIDKINPTDHFRYLGIRHLHFAICILQSFSKIVIATVSLGAIHGLLVLPTFLAAFYDPPNQGIVRLTNIFGPVGGVKGAVMSIRRRIVQSTDVMDSWAPDVGTYR